MTFRHLLAKSTGSPDRPADPETLAGHTELAVRTAKFVAERTGRALLASCGLASGSWHARFTAAMPRAALLHDLGKANDHFQRMVQASDRGRPSGRQGHRHETLSFWLGADAARLGEWLFRSADDIVRDVVLAAVIGHHLKFDGITALRFDHEAADPRLHLLCGHAEFASALHRGASCIPELGAPPALHDTRLDADVDTLSAACGDELRALLRRFRQLAGDREALRFAACVRSTLIAADVAASVRFDNAEQRRSWLEAAVARTAKPNDLEDIVRSRLDPRKPLRPFQERAAAVTSSIALARAGCGTGKTLAAYLWAARRAPGRKLYFCYPTTGTATEGFADYAQDPDLDSDLVHSRAGVDLAELPTRGIELVENAEAEAGAETPRDAAVDAAQRYAAVVASLRLWAPALTVCTADAVLGVLHNYRTPTFAFPVLVSGAFVFDEVHQYDDGLFATLCRFVEEFRGAPVLLMTASLPAHRRRRLEEAAGCRGEALEFIEGPADLEMGKRYTIDTVPTDTALAAALDVLQSGGRVLWVCNTVDRCVAMAQVVRAAGASRVLAYHSRFRYEDRVRRHAEVIAAFRQAGGVIAVTTQVCEVSLDLSADLLVSDVAPVSAMIQRLGRLNRRFDPANPVQRQALFVEVDRPAPYAEHALDEGRRWLRAIPRVASQSDLASWMEDLSGSVPVGAVGADPNDAWFCGWLDPLPCAFPTQMRESNSDSVPVLLDEDADACLRRGGKVDLDAVVRRAIPMPFRPLIVEARWRRVGMAFVAPRGAIAYDSRDGARWVERGRA